MHKSKEIGRSLIKAKKRNRAKYNLVSDRHCFDESADVSHIQSVTDENSLQEFLASAHLADVAFTAERINVKLIKPAGNQIIDKSNTRELTFDERSLIDMELSIPVRPTWNSNMSSAELDQLERQTFLEWRRRLNDFQQTENIQLTPYERSLDIWRQLWRVVERSQLIIIILDARNPFLFRSQSLETYVKESNESRSQLLLLLNKADMLTSMQRQIWANYFKEIKLNACFWSATNLNDDTFEDIVNCDRNSADLLNRAQLLNLLKSFTDSNLSTVDQRFTIGFVGYPNVGKSSTINKLLGSMSAKRVPVSETPGKTKRLQTHLVPDCPQLQLCDCPGLVMPKVASTRAEMLCYSVLSVDHMRDYLEPIQFICDRLPADVFQRTYGVILPSKEETTDVAAKEVEFHPDAHELLTSIAFLRGFMSSKGLPDCSRAARMLIKDVIKGKIVLCMSPPGCDQHFYDQLGANFRLPDCDTLRTAKLNSEAGNTALEQMQRKHLIKRCDAAELDKSFFNQLESKMHVKGPFGQNLALPAKSGIKIDKNHGNKNKKEKLRRRYADLNV